MKNINNGSPDSGVCPDVHAGTFAPPILTISSSSLPPIKNLVIFTKFHLLSDKMHLLHKQAVIFQRRSSMNKKCHITSLVKSGSTSNLCWVDSVAVNVNKQVICLPVIINHVNDFGNLDWLMVEFDDNKKNPLSF